MGRSGDPTAGKKAAEEEEEAAVAEGIWGTWEELLLACAVSRHGAASWDSVAMEVQARTPSAPHLLTPHSCRLRYRLLQRRFGAADSDDPARDSVPLLDELRKLRVAELRREVARSDVSIVSLQLKVKRLKDERDRSLRIEAGEGKPDSEAAEERRDGGSPGPKPESSAGDRSCKESNSTDPKARQLTGGDGGTPGEDAKRAAARDAGPVTSGRGRIAGEGSYNGSSDTIAKGGVPAAETAEGDPARPGEVGESGESVAESKGRDAEAEGEKESSEVQSSASLTRRRRGRRGRVASVSGGGGAEEAEAEEVSKRISSTESQPFMSFLEIVRSHKYGLVFERRLESQESLNYKSTIRQHVDLEAVRAKVDRGAYTCAVEFFRDLLLLCANAIVFFSEDSNESIAAVHLRKLISKEISGTIPRQTQPRPAAPPALKDPTPPLSAVPQRPPAAPKLRAEPDLASSLPSSSAPLIACRKRSSISAKSPVAKAALEEEEVEKKPDPKVEEPDPEDVKKKTKERSSLSGPRSVRTSKSRSAGGSAPAKSQNSAPPSRLSPAPDEPTKSEKKSASSSGVPLSKKRSAASFLSRMKRGSPESKAPLLETLKTSSTGGGGRAAEQKKAAEQKGKREQGTRQAAKKAAAEVSPPAKRSVGRPPKRTAALPAKRAREEPEKPAARKRGRR